MAKKSKKPPSSQAIKSGVKTLRKKGLYKPEKPRAAPTKYAKSLLRRFADVLSGHASVVTATPAKEKRKRKTKGFSAAKEYATTLRTTRNKIIVPTQAGEVARYSPRAKKILVTRRVGADRYIREPFKKPINTLSDLEGSLKRGDRIAVPLFRGSRGVDYRWMTLDDFKAFWREYGPGTKRPYKNLGDHIEAARVIGPSSRELEPDEEEEFFEENIPAPRKKKRKAKSKRKTRLV